MARDQESTQPSTTAQRLSSIVKAYRDIMRKDKGLNGDLDRLPMLTWIMFLKSWPARVKPTRDLRGIHS